MRLRLQLHFRFSRFFGLFVAIYLIAGCAINTPTTVINGNKIESLPAQAKVLNYQGRLSLRIASEPPQSLYAGFSLNGDAQAGNLTLSSPLGNTVAQLAWTPQNAVLIANNETKEHPSASALIENITGATIPLSALFDWLAGKNTVTAGWEIDLSQMKTENANNDTVQRLVAKRTSPQPAAELRIAIDK
jgi:outer membrane lipoprotein LolB